MLNKHNLEVIKFASKENENRYTLEFVRVEKDKTVATNGRMLIEVSRPKVDKQDFPIFVDSPLKEGKVFYLSNKVIKILSSLIPKKHQLPILKNIGISQTEKEIKLLTTDLSSSNTTAVKKEDIQYPDYAKLYKVEGKKLNLSLNASYLKTVCEQVINFTDKSSVEIELTISDSTQAPLMFEAENKETGQKMRGLLMPLKRDAE